MNPEIVFYVSVNGNDGWNGRSPVRDDSGGPFATLAKAVQASRLQKEGADRRIVIGSGCYLDVSIQLTAADSGLQIEAAEGETPVLYGGRRIEGWKKEAQGDFWYAKLPASAIGEWDFRLLTVNGRLCERARLPESGTFLHETTFNVEWLSTSAGGWERKPTYEELSQLTYREGDLGPWLDARNADLTVYHKWDESSVGIFSHDAASRTLVFTHPCGHPPGSFKCLKYVVWNTREGMTRPGQWYLDKTAGRVVYWPLDGEDMERLEAVAPTQDNIIRFIEPAQGITLRGLTLAVTHAPLMAAGFGAYGMPGAIESSVNLDKCRFEALTIRHTGGQGLRLEGALSTTTVSDCVIEDTGACGILFRCKSRAGCHITGNRVHRVGKACTSAIAISSHGCDVIGNEVSDAPYSGIAYSYTAGGEAGVDPARIENNTVSKVMRLLNDGGAIYVTFTENGVVRGNIVSGIQQGDEPDTGRNGIYLDEHTFDWTVEKNLVIDCTHPTLNHMLSGNIYRDNVFVSGSWLKVNAIRCKEFAFLRNILYARGKVIFYNNSGAITDFSQNLLYSESGEYEEQLVDENYRHYETRKLDLRDGTLTADPLFTNPAQGDYTLRPESPGVALGLSGIAMKTILEGKHDK